MSKDYTVTVSAEALCELVLAAHSDIDYVNKPVTSKLVKQAQDEARDLLYGCGYWQRHTDWGYTPQPNLGRRKDGEHE